MIITSNGSVRKKDSLRPESDFGPQPSLNPIVKRLGLGLGLGMGMGVPGDDSIISQATHHPPPPPLPKLELDTVVPLVCVSLLKS